MTSVLLLWTSFVLSSKRCLLTFASFGILAPAVAIISFISASMTPAGAIFDFIAAFEVVLIASIFFIATVSPYIVLLLVLEASNSTSGFSPSCGCGADITGLDLF
ncbi:hypothetical protein BGZ60DRAFT_398523 [Tricladium varicosporioides]|nr:hypothetical protein BGZ60DRAFT_398523 [Hymenoscyphus varicosporioides]